MLHSLPPPTGVPMSRKSASAPRRLYVHAGTVHVLFQGKRFAAPSDSLIAEDLTNEVFIEKLPSNGGRARVAVTCHGEVETWVSWKLS